jgi:tRNA (guanine37-N1)-methyltransferase
MATADGVEVVIQIALLRGLLLIAFAVAQADIAVATASDNRGAGGKAIDFAPDPTDDTFEHRVRSIIRLRHGRLVPCLAFWASRSAIGCKESLDTLKIEKGAKEIMRIDIVTLFPELCETVLASSIIGRAQKRGLVQVSCLDPRRFSTGRHRKLDDRPFGGGPGMVMAAPPIAACLDSIIGACRKRPHLLMPTPQGEKLVQSRIEVLGKQDHHVFICGHYEGIDERIAMLYQPEEFSIGDYVLSGGELAALVLIDAMVRLIPGALGDDQSAVQDSFSGEEGLLDHPCYTQPRVFRGLEVPEVLLGGDHKAIDAWRQSERVRRTKERRK